MLGLEKEINKLEKQKVKKLKIFNEVMLSNFNEVKSVVPNSYISKINEIKEINVPMITLTTTDSKAWTHILVKFKESINPQSANKFCGGTYKRLLEKSLKEEVLKLLK